MTNIHKEKAEKDDSEIFFLEIFTEVTFYVDIHLDKVSFVFIFMVFFSRSLDLDLDLESRSKENVLILS